MKVQMVANCSLTGELILIDQANAYNAPAEIAGMAFSKAAECGNIILGSTTYRLFAEVLKSSLSGIQIAVISSKDIDGDVFTARTAQEAVDYLKDQGFEKACVAGGEKTYNTFLEAELADELFINLFPVVIGGGGVLETSKGKVTSYKLLSAEPAADVVKLHYVKQQ